MIRQSKRQSGFTVTELVVVVIIIAILAVITVVAFNGVQQRANQSASATAVETANKKLEVYKIANRFYPGTGYLGLAEVQDYANTTYQYTSNQVTYCLTATTNKVSMFGSDAAPNPARGACAGHALDGVMPVTNYVLNPSLETGALLPGWSSAAATGYSYSVSSANKYKGNYSALASVSTTTAADSYVYATVTVPTAGTYNVTAWVNISSAAATFTNLATTCSGNRFDARWYNGSTYTSVCYNTTAGVLGTWQQLSATLTAAAANTTFQLRFYPPVANGATMYVDAVMVSNGASNYADGSTTGWAWSGTANGSTSSGPPQ